MMSADPAAGTGARSPFEVPADGWMAVAKRTWKEIGDDNVGIIAAGIAFYVFAAIAPLLGAVVLSYGIFADAETVRRNVESVFASVPREAAAVITDQLLMVVESSKDKQGLGLVIALGIAWYGATKGSAAIVTGLNVAYGETESRGFIRLNLLQLGIVAAGGGLIFVAIIASTLLALLGSLVPGAPALVLTGMRLAGFLVLAAIVVTGIAALFHFGPDHRQPRWIWLSPGSVCAAAFWLGGTALFGIYTSNFASYGATYGSLSAVIVLLTWLWLSAYVLLIGAELNAELERQVAGTAEPSDAPPAPARPVEAVAVDTRSAPDAVGGRGAPTVLATLGSVAAGGVVSTAGFALLRRGRAIGILVVAMAATSAWRQGTRHRNAPREIER